MCFALSSYWFVTLNKWLVKITVIEIRILGLHATAQGVYNVPIAVQLKIWAMFFSKKTSVFFFSLSIINSPLKQENDAAITALGAGSECSYFNICWKTAVLLSEPVCDFILMLQFCTSDSPSVAVDGLRWITAKFCCLPKIVAIQDSFLTQWNSAALLLLHCILYSPQHSYSK